jgi:tRNA dimethylallyltransferase
MKKLLVVVGPTGTGKTALGIELVKKFDGEVVSADSRQVYIGMDIGTGKLPVSAKPKKEEGKWIIDGVPIHLYDLITPDKTFSVAEYQQLAYKAIGEIQEKEKLPILVGGTGLYVQAVVEGLKIPKVAPDKKLRAQLESQPLPTLLSKLEEVDPIMASKIDKQNPRRVIRALEVYYQTGEPLSKLRGKFKVGFDSLQIGLTAPRDYLYQRTDQRIEEWFSEGFIEEVKSLLSKGYNEKLPAMTSLGYRQVAMYLTGKISLVEAKQRIKWEHHSYIRRQTTWFRKMQGIRWFNIGEKSFKQEIFEQVKDWLS